MYKVYLAGPMMHMPEDGYVQDWRLEALHRLGGNGIEVLSPLRGVESQEEYDFYMSRPDILTARDMNDVKMADVVFVNFLGSEKGSIGTSMEIGWASAWQKPIVAVIDEGNIHQHPMIQHTCLVTDDFDYGIELVKKILNR